MGTLGLGSHPLLILLSFTVVIDDRIFIMAVSIKHVSVEQQAPHHPRILSCPWYNILRPLRKAPTPPTHPKILNIDT